MVKIVCSDGSEPEAATATTEDDDEAGMGMGMMGKEEREVREGKA
jgi:hypothetical protein